MLTPLQFEQMRHFNGRRPPVAGRLLPVVLLSNIRSF